MSSLHDFVHHQLGEDPGSQDLHPHIPPEPPRRVPNPPAGGTIPCNAKANRARAEGVLKGELFYSQQEAVNTPRGRVEDEETVIEKVVKKEIFPLG